MWTSEKELAARGIKFYFIIKQDIPEKERTLWEDAIKHSSPLSKWFRRVDFGYSDHPALINEWQGWNLIKVLCPDAQISIRPSECKSFYSKIFLQFSEWFIKFCFDRKVECKYYDFRILFRLHPPESPGEFVPIPSLDDVARKVVSPPSLSPNPPATLEQMLELAKGNMLSDDELEVILQAAEEKKCDVYASYGVRTEEQANTYELEMLVPSHLRWNAEPEGELWHELILQSQEKAPPDFNSIVRALLTKLLQNDVIDSKKIEHISNNPGDYFVARPYGTRFILKFDLKKMDLKRGNALNSVKKDIQELLKDTTYSLFGAVSYELTDEDLTRIEAVIENISYFRNAKRDELFVNLVITSIDSTYDKSIEFVRKTYEILISHKILDTSPGIATMIEDAKKRWNSAVSDCVRDGRKVATFIFLGEISGLPLQVFTGVRESLCEELNKIAVESPHISATITSDNQLFSRFGYYVTPTPKA